MCDYCQDLKSIYWNPKHPMVKEIYIEPDHTLSVTTSKSYENCGTSWWNQEPENVSISNIKINYCPMCGRKFE